MCKVFEVAFDLIVCSEATILKLNHVLSAHSANECILCICVFVYYLCLFMLLCSHSSEHDAHIVQKGGAMVQANDTHTQ